MKKIFTLVTCIGLTTSAAFAAGNKFYSPLSIPTEGITAFDGLYSGSFNDLTGNNNVADGGGLLAADVSGYNFRLFASNGTADFGIGIEPFTGQSALVYGYSQSGMGYTDALEVSSNDPKIFDLSAVDITIDGLSIGTSGMVKLLGYCNGNPVSGAVLSLAVTGASNGGQLVRFNTSANANFVGVDKFRIVTDGSFSCMAIGVDNINAVNFRNTTVLPINVSGFFVQAQQQAVAIYWKANVQKETARFVIEHSSDAIKFSPIVVLPAEEGNDVTYNYTDKDAVAGENYYRLKLLSGAGQEKFFEVKRVTVNRAVLSVYPNPVTGNAVSVCNRSASQMSYSVHSLSGSLVKKGTLANGLQTVRLDGLAKGNYVISFGNGQTVMLTRQ